MPAIGWKLAPYGGKVLLNLLVLGGLKKDADCQMSMRRWRGLPMKLTKPKEERQTAIDSRRFFRRKDAEHPPDPPLIERSEMVNQGEGFLGESTVAPWAKLRIEKPLARRPRHWHHAYERKALVANNVMIAHDDAWPHAMLFVSNRGIELHQNHGATGQVHSLSPTHPSPGIHRTGVPAL